MNTPADPVRRALETADALAGAGRALDAVDYLHAENRALREPVVETRLAELRRDAVLEVDRQQDPPRPRFDDPFPGHVGLIEIRGDEATPEIVNGAVQHHGCVLVRGLLPADAAASLVVDIDRSMDARDAANEGAGPDETAPWYVALPPHPDLPTFRPEARADPNWYRVCAMDAPRTMFNLIEHYEQAGVIDIARAWLGTRPIMTGHKWALRRMPKRKVSGWHQEASVWESTRPVRTINVWMALNECGTDAPGFDVLPRRERELVPPDRNFMLSKDTFAEVAGDEPFASPQYQPGDAMIFDEYLIHRTNTDDSMEGLRYSIESWFFSPAGVPDERDMVVL